MLVDKKVAKGVLLSFDTQSVVIRNKYGDFPLPLELIQEILIVKENPPVPGVINAQNRTVEKLEDPDAKAFALPEPDQPQGPPSQGTQSDAKQLPRIRIALGATGALMPQAYFQKILEYPWPGSSAKITNYPVGGEANLSLYFDYTRVMYFDAYFRYLTMRTVTTPSQTGGLFVDSINGTGYSLHGAFGFVFESQSHLNSVLGAVSERGGRSKYAKWLKHIFPYASLRMSTRSNSLKHGTALANVQISQDLWGGELGAGFKIDFAPLARGLVWKLGAASEFLQGYTSVNADATDQIGYVWKLSTSIAWEFKSGIFIQIAYAFENERYFYRKLFLSDPPYEPLNTQNGHFFSLSTGYVFY